MMNETQKPLYDMSLYELIAEAGLIQDKINIVCCELREMNYDMEEIEELILKYEPDKPVYIMTKAELISTIREKYILYDRVCACESTMPDVFDNRGIDVLIQAYQDECKTVEEPTLIIPKTVKKKDDKEVVLLSNFMTNYKKYRQLQSEVCKQNEINFNSSSLNLLKEMVLNKKPV